MDDRTNAERQARHRAKRRKEQAALEAELRALRKPRETKSGGGATAGDIAFREQILDGLEKEITARDRILDEVAQERDTALAELARAKTRIAELTDEKDGQVKAPVEKRLEAVGGLEPGAPFYDIAKALFATFAGYPDHKGRRIAQRWLNTITMQTRQGVYDKPGPVERRTLAQAKRWVEGKLTRVPGDMGWHVFTQWLRGHEDRVIQITVFSPAGGTPLDGAALMLAALPGVYRIARIESEGSFGREQGEQRRQVRALMAINERALLAQPVSGGWTSADIVIYDPRTPVT